MWLWAQIGCSSGCETGSGSSLKLPQVVVEGLDVGEDTHGVWLPAHHHHILHLDQTVAVCLLPGTTILFNGADLN